MTATNYPACLAFLWRPDIDGQALHVTANDHGGATAWGVTLAVYAAWRAAHGIHSTTAADLAAASQAELSELIRAWFWAPVAGDSLPVGVDLMVFDIAFGSGPGTAVRMLQHACGVAQDGQLGPKTLAAVAKAGPKLIDTLAAFDLTYERGLGGAGGWATFGRGWTARDTARQALARQMAGVAGAVPVVTPPSVPQPAQDEADALDAEFNQGS